MESLQLAHPNEYCTPTGVGATLTRPQLLASFSYGEDRELLLSRETKDAALRWYRQPMLGLDLRYGFERCTWRPEELDESLDALIDTLLAKVEDPRTRSASTDLLGKTAVITWRGMATKLLSCVYEESEGWEMNAMMLQGCLYLEEHKDPHKRRKPQDSAQKLQTYVGYAYEAYCTTDDPRATPAESAETAWGGDVNTNVQWCAITRTALGDVPMILGGEVDCVQAGAGVDHPLETSHFLELKTNLVLDGDRDRMRFERYKLLKHYIQSVLLGVPTIMVGFRLQTGELAGFQSFETLDLPTLVSDKPHVWHATSCLNSGHHILTHILNTVSASAHVKAFDEMPESNPCPVFRVSFTPHNHTISLHQLSGAEIAEVQAGKTRKEPRVGFLSQRWVQSVQMRRNARVGKEAMLNY